MLLFLKLASDDTNNYTKFESWDSAISFVYQHLEEDKEARRFWARLTDSYFEKLVQCDPDMLDEIYKTEKNITNLLIKAAIRTGNLRDFDIGYFEEEKELVTTGGSTNVN